MKNKVIKRMVCFTPETFHLGIIQSRLLDLSFSAYMRLLIIKAKKNPLIKDD